MRRQWWRRAWWNMREMRCTRMTLVSTLRKARRTRVSRRPAWDPCLPAWGSSCALDGWPGYHPLPHARRGSRRGTKKTDKEQPGVRGLGGAQAGKHEDVALRDRVATDAADGAALAERGGARVRLVEQVEEGPHERRCHHPDDREQTGEAALERQEACWLQEVLLLKVFL